MYKSSDGFLKPERRPFFFFAKSWDNRVWSSRLPLACDTPGVRTRFSSENGFSRPQLAEKKAASRQPTFFLISKLHMHVIHTSMRACEILFAASGAEKRPLWANKNRYLLSLLGAHVFRMSASICFVFSFQAAFRFRFISMFSFWKFWSMVYTFGLQVLKFLVTICMMVHLQDSTRKKVSWLFFRSRVSNVCAGRLSQSLNKYLRNNVEVACLGFLLEEVSLKRF